MFSEAVRIKARREVVEVEHEEHAFRVKTSNDTEYLVTVYDDYMTCTCPNGRRLGRARCYHAAAVAEWLER